MKILLLYLLCLSMFLLSECLDQSLSGGSESGILNSEFSSAHSLNTIVSGGYSSVEEQT